ncbi:MAG: acyl-CoA dehydrogenase family protein [Desulfatibacillaceae bacterium]
MDILQYTAEHDEFRQRLRDFMDREIIPRAEEFEKAHHIPKDVWQQMGRAGFLCTNVDKEYGGHGLDFLYSVIVCEEVSRARQSGLAVSLHSDIVVPYIESYGTEEQKKKHLPGTVSGDTVSAVAMTEPGAGSDLASMQATAVEENGEVVLNGTKTFISNGINCGIVVLAARDPEVENPYEAISLYLVEEGTPGFERGRRLQKMGMHAQDTAELFFNNCRIPVENRLGEKGRGFLMLMEKLQQERLVVALMAVFGAERVLEEVTDYLKTHTERSGKPRIKNQAIQFELVEMTTEAKLGRTFVEKLVADHMERKSVVVEVSMAKYWTTDMVNRVADKAVGLLGLDATDNDNVIVRAWRDVRIMPIFAGTNEVMKTVAARFMGL